MKKLKSAFRHPAPASDQTENNLSKSETGSTLPAGFSSGSSRDSAGDRLHEIYKPCEDAQSINLDVVAIHGLMGNPFTTWTKGKDPGSTPWIMDVLPSQLPRARIFSYGYDSSIVRTSSVGGIPEYAMNLLAWLKLKRHGADERRRPLLFICHSLGGIITKKALIIAHNRKDEEFIGAVKGIAFLGVPHHGSGIVDLGKYFAYLLRSFTGKVNSDLLNDLETRSKVLNDISIDVTHLICQLRIVTFYETRKFPGLGRLIVDEASARLNSPNEEVVPINADHSSICKFASGDANCELIAGSIAVLANSITRPAPSDVLDSPRSNIANHVPKLTIHVAMWGERDVTSVLTSKIKPEDQTLEIDTMHDLDTADPWYQVHKATSIIYSYSNAPLNLLVTHDGAGVFSISPHRIEPISFFAPAVDRNLKSKTMIPSSSTRQHEKQGETSQIQKMEILAVIWGCMLGIRWPISQALTDQILIGKRVRCTNEAFGFDGYPNEHKTCQIFYRMSDDPGRILCKVAREHETMTL